MTLSRFVGARRWVQKPLVNTMLWVAGFALVNAAVRRAAGAHLSMDDAKTNLFTQVWQWGYQPDNPPLFEWLLICLKPFAGGGLASFLVLKYSALVVAAFFTFLVVRQLRDDRTARIVTLGAVLLVQIGWNYHQAFTHSALLVPAVMGGLWATLKAVRVPSFSNACLLGLVVGVTLLTKYNVVLLWLGVLGVGAADPVWRRAFCRPCFAVVPVIAAIICLPHLLWFLGQTDAYRASVSATLGLEQGSHVWRAGEGLLSLAVSSILFFLPFLVVTPRAIVSAAASPPHDIRNVLNVGMFGLASLAAMVVIFGVGEVSERYLLPVGLPIYVAAAIGVLDKAPEIARRIQWAAAAVAVVIVVARIAGFAFPGPPWCTDCRDFIPYNDLKSAVVEEVPEGSILIVREENTGGNLVGVIPDTPVRVFTSLHLTNPIREDGRPCYLVWSKDMIDPDLPLEPPIQYMETDPATRLVVAPWRHPLRPDGWRTTRWGITPIDKENLYKDFCTVAR